MLQRTSEVADGTGSSIWEVDGAKRCARRDDQKRGMWMSNVCHDVFVSL